MISLIRKPCAAGLIAGLSLVLLAPVGPAHAKTVKPAPMSSAWYWEEQRRQTVQDPDGTDAATLEFPNPFCPGAPGNLGAPDATCRAGRLPVEVRGGDYKSPNMISALGLDLTAAPIGSAVQKFTVTLKEASDDQSKPINAAGQKIQACPVREFFGDGEARLYKEAPKFSCSKSDPLGARKRVKGKKGSDPTFEWTFDLTPFAKKWVAKGAPVTAVMFMPVEPKNPAPGDREWRVVFTGAAKPEEKGVRSILVFEPAEFEDPLDNLNFGAPGSGSGSSGGFGSTGGFGFGGDGGGGGSSSLDGGKAPKVDPSSSATEPETTDDAANAAAEAEELTAPIGVPWYMWIAILLGIAGFTLVRNFVLESATGMRPNGVLAQIKRINADRRGSAVTDPDSSSAASALSGLVDAGRKVGGTVRSLAGKIRFGGRS